VEMKPEPSYPRLRLGEAMPRPESHGPDAVVIPVAVRRTAGNSWWVLVIMSGLGRISHSLGDAGVRDC
jgi:hypothetical protein